MRSCYVLLIALCSYVLDSAFVCTFWSIYNYYRIYYLNVSGIRSQIGSEGPKYSIKMYRIRNISTLFHLVRLCFAGSIHVQLIWSSWWPFVGLSNCHKAWIHTDSNLMPRRPLHSSPYTNWPLQSSNIRSSKNETPDNCFLLSDEARQTLDDTAVPTKVHDMT